MTDQRKLDSQRLRAAALRTMERAGKPLTPIASRGRSQVFRTADGKTVRLRTDNNRKLIAQGEDARCESRLSIEGTDFVLLAIPMKDPSRVESYLIPAEEAAEALRRACRVWYELAPARGDNLIRAVMFDDGPRRGLPPDAPQEAWWGFGRKWQRYRVGEESADAVEPSASGAGTEGGDIASAIESLRQRIASAWGVPREAVRIEIKVDLPGGEMTVS